MLKKFYQSFWFSDAIAKEKTVTINKLNSDINTDICIVGGGFTGLWTAIQLKKKQPSLSICIIDKGLCGSGASGRNGGCMLPVSPKYYTMKKLVGKNNAILWGHRGSSPSDRPPTDFLLAKTLDLLEKVAN